MTDGEGHEMAIIAKCRNIAVPEQIVDLLLDPTAYANDRVLQAYAWLRENAPLAVIEREGFDPFRVVTRYADIREISRRNDQFHAGARFNPLIDKAGADFILSINDGSPHLVDSIVFMDSPRHMPHRLLTQNWFMPSNLRKLEDRIRVIARDAIDRMAAMDGRCDFAKDVAFAYPLHVIMSIFGVPAHDEPIMHRLTQDLFGGQDPEVTGAFHALDAEAYAANLHKTVAGFSDYFAALSADRRANPRDDLATVIAHGQIRGEPIGKSAETGYYIAVATAGHDTTSISTATAMEQLALNPDQFAKVQANPSLIPCLVDEAIRWATPIKHFMRSAAVDTEFAGEQLKANEWLMLCYASGNRDETVFDAPERFDIERSPNPHLSFGYGAHLCIGQHLAKLEMKILFEELIARIASVSLDGEASKTKSWFISGIRCLPVTFTLK
ncbi:cytochrome P450 [Sphingobium sp. 3R8]|uniref:cytochrome P450 n=1 Tax=Sphingobium sp. 3R8 TaxID=2874921 RepID=UPI001CCEA3D9|nr:cytochrome P450 [Sphingobium sp. 3R8]MBZ9646902.1 cytochrome P450 [Sphingobium sp. 3R8]